MLRSSTAAVLALLAATAAQARTLEVGPGKAFEAPSAAVAAAAAGDTVAVYPGQYFDCAVVTKNDMTIEGIGDADKVVMTDKACEGKALLVIRGESNDITIDRVRFVNNQNGILSGTEGGRMTIRDSVFERNGFCGAACSHGVYVGHLDVLHIENSRFFNTQQAHHIKSRARRTEVIDCDIQDGPDGTASYEVEAPNGGSVIVRDSRIVKGPKAENHTAAIMIGSEGVTQMTPEIVVANNVFRNDGSYPTIFVDNLTATEAQLSGNKISGAGPVRPLKGDGRVVASN